jgi:hypothetical protein
MQGLIDLADDHPARQPDIDERRLALSGRPQPVEYLA